MYIYKTHGSIDGWLNESMDDGWIKGWMDDPMDG